VKTKQIDISNITQLKDFKRVCKIVDYQGEWYYQHIDKSIMYDSHTSWVYAIVVNGVIWKIGASGVPLGIRTNDAQPKKGTKCRFGRYRAHKGSNGKDDTDEYCRDQLRSTIKDLNNCVEFWAMKCPVVKQTINVGYDTIELNAAFHFELEKRILNDIVRLTGNLPMLNKGLA
jgi:hypothetical protein